MYGYFEDLYHIKIHIGEMRIHCTVYIAAAELILRKILAGMFLQCFLVEGTKLLIFNKT